MKQRGQRLLRRKFKRLHDNKTRWWHIVSGDEGDLDKLEGEWEISKSYVWIEIDMVLQLPRIQSRE